MDRWVGKVALVTGTSSGIGEDIAKSLVEKGVKVVGLARRKERLESLAKQRSSSKGKFFPFPGDVSKEEDILKAFKWTKENVGPVSILINNAGILGAAQISQSSSQDWADLININLLAPCITAREAIRQMKENKIDGHIININSIAGHKVLNFDNLNLYPGTKFGLKAATETLRLEMARQKSKIKVTSISPGRVKTEMTDAGFKNFTPEQIRAMGAQDLVLLAPEDVTEAVVYALSTRPNVQVTELIVQSVEEAL